MPYWSMQKRKPRVQPRKNRRLSAKDWIAEALQLLITKGIDAVRVEVLARRLGVTKGSFYWPFRERAELLGAILATWQQRQTQATIERLEKANLSPAGRIRELLDLPTHAKGTVATVSTELAIRAWAWRD